MCRITESVLHNRDVAQCFNKPIGCEERLTQPITAVPQHSCKKNFSRLATVIGQHHTRLKFIATTTKDVCINAPIFTSFPIKNHTSLDRY